VDDRWGSIGEAGDILIIIAVIRIMVAIVPLRRAADPVASKWLPHRGCMRETSAEIGIAGAAAATAAMRARRAGRSPARPLPRRQAACLAGGSSERGPGTLFEK